MPQRVLASLGARFDARRDRYLAPEESTVRRLTQQVDGDLLDAAICDWLSDHPTGHPTGRPTGHPGRPGPATAIAVDGKSLRGTFARTGGAGVPLLAALTHTTGDHRTEGIVQAQRQVARNTSEIAWFAPVLDDI